MENDSELTSYDSIAEIFTEHAGHPDSWNNLYERPYMLDKLPPLRGKNVLDLGCASGFYTEHALKQGARVTAVDASRKLIDRLASEVKTPGLTLRCADISQPMPFLESDYYHCVIASLVLDYIKDWDSLLSELYRVVKRGGQFIISTHHPFADYLHLEPESYYDFKLVEDDWGGRHGISFKTYYYIRPLDEVLRPILQSKFKMESIVEMRPEEGLKETHPELYQRLIERPGFLYIELEK